MSPVRMAWTRPHDPWFPPPEADALGAFALLGATGAGGGIGAGARLRGGSAAPPIGPGSAAAPAWVTEVAARPGSFPPARIWMRRPV
ncbi:hypothetical protein SAMN05216574_115100 [Blastococcus tunisiensis]|uniref:Uncharacterized protein n=1 Tax=Blastococcus tunisiensis TaxID=1798228 RepID=A0A1I2JEP3_9ACTN|nr:hypothetical protein SAMN05216574_115100 [Blastococcus sp. DSM 46838]